MFGLCLQVAHIVLIFIFHNLLICTNFKKFVWRHIPVTFVIKLNQNFSVFNKQKPCNYNFPSRLSYFSFTNTFLYIHLLFITLFNCSIIVFLCLLTYSFSFCRLLTEKDVCDNIETYFLLLLFYTLELFPVVLFRHVLTYKNKCMHICINVL